VFLWNAILAHIYALPKTELTASKNTCPFSNGTPTMPTMLPLGPLVLLQGRTNTLWTPEWSKLRRSAFIFQQQRNMCVSKSKDHDSNWFCSSCAARADENMLGSPLLLLAE
jgi:hypothetical protein